MLGLKVLSPNSDQHQISLCIINALILGVKPGLTLPAFHLILLLIFIVSPMAGEVSNRSAQGQAFCNMGFAQSQLGEYKKAGESFMHAIQAAKDSSDNKGLWQAYEGLAAVSFLGQDYDRAVEYYKLALSVLSTTGEADVEHNNRIVSKLANALECQVVFSNKLNGKLPPLRIDSVKSDRTVVEKRNGKDKRVGKTRSRQEHHQLIARGIDGDQTPSESEDSVDGSQESSSDEESMQEEAVKERQKQQQQQQMYKQRVITTEAEVHHQRTPSQRARKKSSTDSSQEERAVKERERRRKKPQHSRKPKSSSPQETLNSTRGENHYERLDEVDNTRASAASPAKSDYSDDMPRAHREAYLASVQASTTARPTPDRTEARYEESVQSRTCVIQ